MSGTVQGNRVAQVWIDEWMVERLSRDFLFPVELEEEVEPLWGFMGQLTDGIIGAVKVLGKKLQLSWFRVQIHP